MINVTVRKKGDLIKKINITGHARYDIPGNDIVCAGVSALYFAAVNSLKKYADSKLYSIESERGDSEITFIIYEEYTQLIANFFLTGIENIEKEYRNFVHIEEVNLNGS